MKADADADADAESDADADADADACDHDSGGTARGARGGSSPSGAPGEASPSGAGARVINTSAVDESGPLAASKPKEIALAISPSGRLHFDPGHDDEAAALLDLGARLGESMPGGLLLGRELAKLFLNALAATENLEILRESVDVKADDADLDRLVASAPPMKGGEYLRRETLLAAWQELLGEARKRIAAEKGKVADLLQRLDPSYAIAGRVCFHLAENKRDEERPFAFLATYARHGEGGVVRHAPLARALEELGGERKAGELKRLLEPVRRAADGSPLVKTLLDEGDVFHPLAWTPAEAHELLKQSGAITAAGVVVKMPDFLRRPPRPTVKVTLGKKKPGGLGLDAMLDFDVSVTLDGEPLTAAERKAILAAGEGFVFLKGRWVEVSAERLRAVLGHWEAAASAADDGVSFAEAMRLLSRIPEGDAAVETAAETARWSDVTAGPWLGELLADLRDPAASKESDPGTQLNATLRPYQRAGVAWLFLLARLGLGACLADDMGLGKTIQVLSLVLSLRKRAFPGPHLLVLPASLIGNWTSEIERFAPSLRYTVVHPSQKPLAAVTDADFDADLVLTTYGTVSRLSSLAERSFGLLVLDEAQAIKNPQARQTRAVKALRAKARIALTGTPIENDLGDLWSLFDFLDPGLLGSATQFRALTKRLEKTPGGGYGPLRALVRPYLLRRMKTDRTVVSDLPDKTEVIAHCSLSKTQATLYQRSVEELADALKHATGIKKRGLVLAYLLRFKQICNHPSQWLGDGAWKPQDSGKMKRLTELCESIAARQEKVLIFTQFRETTAPLAHHLSSLFGRPGLVLSGETAVKKRRQLVDEFQSETGPPFFVLSVKAGGTGLNLTAASHVIHFDRWWNPAVEAQATDRAFRIGQKKNVLVHKLVCKGTVEEKIDRMIEEKKALAAGIFEGSMETALTELPADELLRLVSLDITRATEDA